MSSIKTTLFLKILPVLLLTLSCTKDNRCGCFDSNGPETTEIRFVDLFCELEVDNVFEILLKIDTISKVEIYAGRNILKGIVTEVKNNKLYLRNLNRCNWTRKYRGMIQITVYTPCIKSISLNESCNLKCFDTISVDDFRFDNWSDVSRTELNIICTKLVYALHAGSGDVVLKGSAEIAYFWSMGYGYFRNEGFNTNNCFVMNNSTGNMYVSVINELEATIINSGNIYYKGNPAKIVEINTGKGKLIKY